MTHELKILPNYYKDLEKGIKNFEVRKNDRDYQVGDFIALNEWVKEEKCYTGKSLLYRITYILNDEDYCKKGYVILSIKKCSIVPYYVNDADDLEQYLERVKE